MAQLMIPKTRREINRIGVATVRQEYNALADYYKDLVDLKSFLPCFKCGEWLPADKGFYLDKGYFTERFPVCRKCLLKMAEQREKDNDEPHETKESVQKVLHFMNRVYDDAYYEACIKHTIEDISERNKPSTFQAYITAISSLTQFRGKTWADSTFGDSDNTSAEDSEIKIIQKTIKNAKKRFGSDYKDEDLMFLENEYQDWITRYECNTKAQEEVFENLSIIKLLKKKALAKGDSTKDLDAQQQQWLDTGNLKPKQNTLDTGSDAQTFGTLIQKWEETKPIPECDPELADVDKIGLYIDVFFKGHTSKMLGLKNTFTHIYENFMNKYTVKPPTYEDEQDSEEVFEKVFGSSIDG